MGFINAPLISAHASLIGAPSSRRYDPLDQQIKQEQLLAMRLRNASMTSQPVDVKSTVYPQSTVGKTKDNSLWMVTKPAEFKKGSYAGADFGGSPGVVSFGSHSQMPGWDKGAKPVVGGGTKVRIANNIRSETPQEQLQKNLAHKALYGDSDDVVVEARGLNGNLGNHSNDAWFDQGRNAWVRKYRPGEKEAIALDKILGVKDYYSFEADKRKDFYSEKEYERRGNLDTLQNYNRIGRDILSKQNIVDMSAKVLGVDDNGKGSEKSQTDERLPINDQMKHLVGVTRQAASDLVNGNKVTVSDVPSESSMSDGSRQTSNGNQDYYDSVYSSPEGSVYSDGYENNDALWMTNDDDVITFEDGL